MSQYNTIAESNNFIVLDAYTKYNELHEPSVVYQSEASLEREFIQDLVNQGYEYRQDISTPDALLSNARIQIQNLNDVEFSDKEWLRFGVCHFKWYGQPLFCQYGRAQQEQL